MMTVWEDIYSFNKLVYAYATNESAVSIAWKLLISTSPVCIGSALILLLTGKIKNSRSLPLWIGFLSVAIFNIFFQRHYFIQYTTPLLLIAAVVISIGVSYSLTRYFRTEKHTKPMIRTVQAGIILSLFIAVYLGPLLYKRIYFPAILKMDPSIVQNALGHTIQGFDQIHIASISAKIRGSTHSSDSIQVLGDVPFFYLQTERFSPSRFYSLTPLFIRPEQTQAFPLQLLWRQEFLTTLRNHPPIYIIAVDQYEGMFFPDGKSAFRLVREEMSDFFTWMQNQYVLEQKANGYLLFKNVHHD
jgi:hypothetical protein